MKVWMKTIRHFFIISFLIYVLIVAGLYFFQRSLLYFPPILQPDQYLSLLNGYDPVRVTTKDSLRLTGFFTPPSSPSKPIILVFHGNASHPAWKASYFSEMIRNGYGVFLAEYRGYGGNDGVPSENGLYEDAAAYRDSQIFIKEFPDNPVVLYGQSLGAAVAVQLAFERKEQFLALVLEVPFDSLESVVAKQYPFVPFKDKLIKDHYSSDKKILQISIPKFFILAGRDEVVGYESGKRLFDKAPIPKDILDISKAGHNDTALFGSADYVQNFIESVLTKNE